MFNFGNTRSISIDPVGGGTMVVPVCGRTAAALLAFMSMITGGSWARPAFADQSAVNWSGVYVGAHMGGALDFNDFSNPYGTTLFGDEVRNGPAVGVGTSWSPKCR